MQAMVTFSGPLRVTLGDGTDITPGSPLRQAILAVLVAAPGQIRARKALQDMFWASADPAHAGASLRSALYLLRKDLNVLGPDWLRADRLTVSLRFGQLVAKGSNLPNAAFLEGMDLPLADCEGFEDWLRTMRQSLADANSFVGPINESRPQRPVNFHSAELPLFPSNAWQSNDSMPPSVFEHGIRVRWAFEEVNQPYDTRLLSLSEKETPAHRKFYPRRHFPTPDAGNLALFESGAIVLDIAERHAGLLPSDPQNRSQAISWMFAALSTVEPPIREFGIAAVLREDRPWYGQHLKTLKDRIRPRLSELSSRLGTGEWLEDVFTAGDLLMITVLRKLEGSDLLNTHENLSAYVARGQSRAPFKRAFDAQLEVFTGKLSGHRSGEENRAANIRLTSLKQGTDFAQHPAPGPR